MLIFFISWTGPTGDCEARGTVPGPACVRRAGGARLRPPPLQQLQKQQLRQLQLFQGVRSRPQEHAFCKERYGLRIITLYSKGTFYGT